MRMVHAEIPPVVYGPTDVARVLGISVGYVHRLIELGTARPSVPMGLTGRRVFSPEDLRRLASAIGRDFDHQTPPEAA